jgi:3-oxoacyl-[acyl-carrier protein] reductase
VAVVGRDLAAIATVVETITSEGGHAIGVSADCTVEADLDALRDQVVAQLGRADILAVFAGGNGMPAATATETPGHWRFVVDSDLTSVFLTISVFLPDMISAHRGVIVTMASAAARQAARSSAAYAAAKAGVVAFSRHLANEVAGEGIRVNCIAPSAVENDKMRSWVPIEQRRQMDASFPLGRIGQPDDVAAATLFLASQASSWITGITLDIAPGSPPPGDYGVDPVDDVGNREAGQCTAEVVGRHAEDGSARLQRGARGMW